MTTPTPEAKPAAPKVRKTVAKKTEVAAAAEPVAPPKPVDTRLDRIRTRLQKAFPDAAIDLEDESHLHAGHAGSRSGRGHYKLKIVSPTFENQPPTTTHRAVYMALGELMQFDIHALSIDARAS